MMSFRYEAEMVEHIVTNIEITNLFPSSDPSTRIYYGCEVPSLFGIPDIVFTNCNQHNVVEEVIAVELKLKNWKKALLQAFRYRSFADLSFVILDDTNINSAMVNIEEFKKSNIGLLGLTDEGELIPYYIPSPNKPFSDRLVSEVSTLVQTTEIFKEY